MKRVFWLGVGMAVGATVVYKAATVAHRASPSHLAAQATDCCARTRRTVEDFLADLTEGMSQREAELRAKHGLGSEAL